MSEELTEAEMSALDEGITIGEFLNMIGETVGPVSAGAGFESIVGASGGGGSDRALNRREAARLLHGLLLSRGEADTEEWSAALDLSDLHECRVCVMHIAQMYAKGIMGAREAADGSGRLFFCGTAEILRSEAAELLDRAGNVSKRTPPRRRPVKFNRCSFEALDREILKAREIGRRLRVIDVREAETTADACERPEMTAVDTHKTPAEMTAADTHKPPAEETEKTLPCHELIAERIPLRELWLNPYAAGPDVNAPVYLFCNRGYLSSLAAELLLRYGYRNVTVAVEGREASCDLIMDGTEIQT